MSSSPIFRTSYTQAPKVIVAMGDSYTFNYTLGLKAWEFYPTVLSKRLTDNGYPFISRNWGISGNTTAQMLGRFAIMTQFEVPDLAVLWGGENDGGVSATTTANLTTMIRSLQGSPIAPTLSTSTTGGQLTTATYTYFVTAVDSSGGESYPSPSTSIAVTGPTGLVVITWASVRNATKYKIYGRTSGSYGLLGTIGSDFLTFTDYGASTPGVALPTTNGFTKGCQKILIVGHFYTNQSGGGSDTLITPNATNLALRNAQQAAVTNIGDPKVVFVDLYNSLRDRIITGVDIQGSASWHVSQSNDHPNNLMETIIADTCFNTIQNQSGWLQSFR